jgi:CubicO group peptidase (beta-lactamase class C family)
VSLRGVSKVLICASISSAGTSFAIAQTPGPLPKAQPEQVACPRNGCNNAMILIGRNIEKGEIAGAVRAVARRGKLVEFKAQGYSDLEAHTPMRTDAIFRMASMTKPVATVAAPLPQKIVKRSRAGNC